MIAKYEMFQFSWFAFSFPRFGKYCLLQYGKRYNIKELLTLIDQALISRGYQEIISRFPQLLPILLGTHVAQIKLFPAGLIEACCPLD